VLITATKCIIDNK